MYTDIESCIINAGWQSAYFKLQRGIRQGCPLSALLFNLVVEILGTKIRQTCTVKGINVEINDNMFELKISQVADDTTLTLCGDDSIRNALQIVDDFSNVAGPTLNRRKCEAMWIGANRGRRDTPFGIDWPNRPIKSLGIYYGLSEEECETLNWEKRIDNFENMLLKWLSRKLTLYGKVLIIKTLAISQLIYNMSMISTPDWALKRIEKACFSFLWNRKPDKIKRKVLYSNYQEGGLKMVDIYSKRSSLQAVWVKRLMQSALDDTKERHWHLIPLHFINHFGKDFLLFRFNFCKGGDAPSLRVLPPFYRQVVLTWHELGGGKTDFVRQRQEIIWCNKNYKLNNSTLFFEHWIRSGLIYVNDLCENSEYVASDILLRKLSDKRNWMSEFMQVKRAIGYSWTDENDCTGRETLYGTCVWFNSSMISLDTLNSRYLYSVSLMENVVRPTAQAYWDSVTPNLDWKAIWESQTCYIRHNKLREFNFKLLHKILPCRYLLNKWKIRDTSGNVYSPFCDICNKLENYEHMFLECNRLRKFWGRLNNTEDNQSVKNVLLEHNKCNITLLTIAKFSIYISWIRWKDNPRQLLLDDVHNTFMSLCSLYSAE